VPLRAYTGARANAVVSVFSQLIAAVVGGYRYILLLTGDVLLRPILPSHQYVTLRCVAHVR